MASESIETALSEVDGSRGRLTIAGRDVERWAEGASFEDACSLLWNTAGAAVHDVQPLLGRLRVEAFARIGDLGDALRTENGMDALRAATAHLRSDDPATITAAVAVFAAAWARIRAGESPVLPDPQLDHAEDYLRMVTGRPVPAVAARAVSTYLVTVSEHGMNASTFSARVVASTQSDMVSAIVAALGALKGPLHGGAPGPVLDMLDAIGEPSRAQSFIENELAQGRRLMGLGHRVYRVRDPRACVLERATLALTDDARFQAPRLTLARAVERVATAALAAKYPQRSLEVNVEFYTAILLDAVGLPREAFTPTFAVGRVVGWCAHVLEQRAKGRLIRPESRYIGAAAD